MHNQRNGKFWIRIWSVLGVIALCIVSGIVGGALTTHLGRSTYTISYVDFISVMLTSIAVLMTVLALFLAVLGVLGWNSITSKVRDRTEEFLDDGFKKGNPLYLMLQSQANKIMYEGVAAVEEVNEADESILANRVDSEGQQQ